MKILRYIYINLGGLYLANRLVRDGYPVGSREIIQSL